MECFKKDGFTYMMDETNSKNEIEFHQKQIDFHKSYLKSKERSKSMEN